jgi:hypothetical protein
MGNPVCKSNIKKCKPTLCTLYIEQEDYSCQAAGQKYNGNCKKEGGGDQIPRLVENQADVLLPAKPMNR